MKNCSTINVKKQYLNKIIEVILHTLDFSLNNLNMLFF